MHRAGEGLREPQGECTMATYVMAPTIMLILGPHLSTTMGPARHAMVNTVYSVHRQALPRPGIEPKVDCSA